MAALVAGAHLTAMLPNRTDWAGIWTQTAGVFGQSLVLTLPVSVAAASWHFGQVRQSTLGLYERTSSRRRWAREARQVAEFALVAGLGLAVAAAWVGIATASKASVGRPDLLTLLAVCGWMAVAGAIGLRVGGIGRFAVLAPIAGVATYAALSWVVVRDDGTMALLAPMDWRWMALYCKAGCVSILQLYFAVALSLLILGIRRQGRALRWSATAVAVAVGVTLVTWGAEASRQPDEQAARLVCSATVGQPTVCLPAVRRHQKALLVKSWSLVSASAPGLLPPDFAYVDDEARGLGDITDRRIDEVVAALRPRPTLLASEALDLSAGTQVPIREFAAQTVDVFVAPQHDRGVDPPASTDDPRITATPSLVVRQWLYQQLRLPTDGSAYMGSAQIDSATVDYSVRATEMRWFAALSREQRSQWFTTHGDELRQGTLPWSAFATQ